MRKQFKFEAGEEVVINSSFDLDDLTMLKSKVRVVNGFVTVSGMRLYNIVGTAYNHSSKTLHSNAVIQIRAKILEEHAERVIELRKLEKAKKIQEIITKLSEDRAEVVNDINNMDDDPDDLYYRMPLIEMIAIALDEVE